MPILLNHIPLSPLPDELGPNATVGDALAFITTQLDLTGSVVTHVELDGKTLDGPTLPKTNAIPLGASHLSITSAVQTDLARTLIGKLGALVQHLGERQHAIAAVIEQGQSAKALPQVADLLSAWQQVSQAFDSLIRMLKINLAHQTFNERPGVDLIAEFSAQLQEIGNAITNHDMVLLGDVLQYEMDAAIRNWTDLLATTLGIVDGVVAQAA